MYELMGKSGRFQKTMMVASIIALFLSSFPVNFLSYASPDPISECKINNISDIYEPCTEQKACSLISSKMARLRFQNENWTSRYGMYCDKEYERNVVKSSYIVWTLILNVVGLMLADCLGRKFAFKATFAFTFTGCAVMYFSDTFFLKILGLSIVSCCSGIFSSLFTIALSEWIPSTERLYNYIVVLMFTAFPLGNICFSLIVRFNSDSSFLSIVTITGILIGSFVPCILAKESPLFLMKSNKLSKLRSSVLDIASANRLSTTKADVDVLVERMTVYSFKNLSIVENQIEKSDREQSPLVKILTNKLFFFQILALSAIGGYLQIVFYGI